MINKNNLIWIDLEMTGLNPEKHKILEIATVITDNYLNILSNGPVITLHQSKKHILSMDKWNQQIHSSNNLLQRTKNSCYNEKKAEKITLNFIKKWVSYKHSPMCGNTVSQDRRFLFKYMPKLESYFHYRHIDVSTIKELAKRWNTKISKNIKKNEKHIAILDIYESIRELRYYQYYFIKNRKNTNKYQNV